MRVQGPIAIKPSTLVPIIVHPQANPLISSELMSVPAYFMAPGISASKRIFKDDWTVPRRIG